MGKLSDKAVQAAEIKGKQYGISDGDGLTLIIKTTGTKLWWLRYRFGGKAKTLSLGEYPLVSLKEAREKAFFAKKALLEGRDPSAEKIAAKKEIIKIQEEKESSLATTFESVAREWFGKFSKSNNWAENHSSKILGRLEKDIFPWLPCPMCGSLHSGTLDHIFPQSDYPEFAVFSRNLVPACKCNSKRQNDLLGDGQGERILHPYYDVCLGERLLSARCTKHIIAHSQTIRSSLLLLFLSVHNKPYTNWEIYHERLAFSCYRNSWRSNRNIRIKI